MSEMLALSAALPELTCPRGAALIREGDAHGQLFVLVDGELEALGFRDAHPLAARVGATTLARRLDTISGYLVDLRRQYGDHGNLGMLDAVLESLRHHQVRASEPGSDRERDAPY